MKTSAGILLYRFVSGKIEFMLVHPGGPFWKNKDEGSWTIPKGEVEENEELMQAAKREFEEETGFNCDGKLLELSPRKQKSGKWVYAWALEKDIDIEKIKSNSFQLEWPPKSGKMTEFPEIDKAAWFSANEAKKKINAALIGLIDEVMELVKK